MDFKQLQKEFRKLETEAGEDTANALISLISLLDLRLIASYQGG